MAVPLEVEDDALELVEVELIDDAGDELMLVLEEELETGDDVEVALGEALDDDDIVCVVILVECQMYMSSLAGPPHHSLELPLQGMSHCRLQSTAGPPLFMSWLPQ